MAVNDLCAGKMNRRFSLLVVPFSHIRILVLKASIGNGVTAILAGIVSQVLEDSFGHIGESLLRL